MELNENKEKYDFYLLITSEYGKSNSGTLIRSASAFNCKEILILGKDKKILKKFFGNHGTVKKMKFQFFESTDLIIEYCKKNSINICCVNINFKESKEKSTPIEKTNFNGNTLFILGNTSNQINTELLNAANQYIYVNQPSNLFGEINLSIVGSITFHYFGLWAGYIQAGLNDKFNSEKYVVDNKKVNSKENYQELKVQKNNDNLSIKK